MNGQRRVERVERVTRARGSSGPCKACEPGGHADPNVWAALRTGQHGIAADHVIACLYCGRPWRDVFDVLTFAKNSMATNTDQAPAMAIAIAAWHAGRMSMPEDRIVEQVARACRKLDVTPEAFVAACDEAYR